MTCGRPWSSGPALRSHVVRDRDCERPDVVARLDAVIAANLRELGHGG